MIRRRLVAPLFLVVLVFALLPTVGQGQTPPDVMPDQFIVVLEPGADPAVEARRAERAHGVQTLHVYEHAVRGFAFKGSAQAAQALARDPNVAFVSQDRLVQASAQALPTGVKRIGGDLNATARIDGVDERVNVNVAVIDTGIDAVHPDLNVVGGKNCSTGNSYNDGNGHGSHVAGTVGALDNSIGVVGVAPGARLWAVRVLNNAGSGTWSSVICGVDWVTATRTDTDATNDIAVANMSLGGGGVDDGNCGNTNSDALHLAICNSVAKGVVYVVAAGNDNQNAAGFVPAAYDEVLTISAIADYNGAAGGGAAATCANYGADDTLASFSNYGADVDIATPGVCILSTYKGGGYATLSGTSMASPHVAGVAALYVANNGGASDATGVAAIRTAIKTSGGGYSVAQSAPQGFTGDKDGFAEPMAYVGAQHDVAVSAISAPASVVQGDAASISVDVANPGSYAESVTVTLSDTTAATTIGSQSVSLAAGTSTTLVFSWATSSTTAAGDHLLKAEASQVTGETNTGNNAKTATVTVKQASHDLTVTSVTAPASVVQGDSASVSVAVSNEGTYTETFTVTLTDTTAATSIGSQSVSLAAGASTTLTFSWTTTSTTATGDHLLTAEASQVSGETDTADNSKTATVTVKEASHDVAVTAVTAPAEVAQGASASVEVSLANEGTYSESFTVTLRDATDGVDIGSQTVSLEAGASSTVTFTWAPSSSTSLGTHTLTATASTVSGETDTADNSKSTTVNVTAGTMHVGDLDGASTKLQKGQWMATVTIAVHDQAHNAMGGATVYGTFTQGTWSKSVSCVTGATGTCTVDSGTFPSNDGKASFRVDSVAGSLSYDAAGNHDPDGDSDGTTISLSK